MTPLAVVEDFDVFLDGRFRVCPRGVPLVMDHFVLQATPEALHRRVVVAVPLARHGCPHAELRDQFPIVVSAILAASVRVENQPWRRPLSANSPPQRLRCQFLRHARAERVADHLTGEDVLDARQVEPSFVGGDIRDIADPGFVWSRRREGLLQQVRRHREAMARIRRRLELALLLATQAKFPPQPNDPITTSVKALRDQFRLQTQWPVGFTGLDVGSLDGDLQSFIVPRALRWRAIERRIKSAA